MLQIFFIGFCVQRYVGNGTAVSHTYKNRRKRLYILCCKSIRRTYWTYPLKTECRNQKRKRMYWQADLELGSPTAVSRVVCHTKKNSIYERKYKRMDYENIEKRIFYSIKEQRFMIQQRLLFFRSASVFSPITRCSYHKYFEYLSSSFF